jgi:hypothetical protein
MANIMAEQDGTALGREADLTAAGIEISEQELAQRKQFLELGEEDFKRLTGISDLARHYADAVIEDFYRHLLSFEDSRSFFSDPQVLQRVKGAWATFLSLDQGPVASQEHQPQLGRALPQALAVGPLECRAREHHAPPGASCAGEFVGQLPSR